jgi:hypothetical protein
MVIKFIKIPNAFFCSQHLPPKTVSNTCSILLCLLIHIHHPKYSTVCHISSLNNNKCHLLYHKYAPIHLNGRTMDIQSFFQSRFPLFFLFWTNNLPLLYNSNAPITIAAITALPSTLAYSATYHHSLTINAI